MSVRILQLAAVDLSQEAGIPDRTILNTRYFGRQFFRVLSERLNRLPEATVVELSLRDVEVLDASFADAVLGSLVSMRLELEATLAPLYLADVNESQRDNIEYTLVSRPERQPGLRNCAIPVKLPSGDLTLIGKSEDGFRRTFDLLRAFRQLRTRQVADAMKLTPQAASSRLKALSDHGVALRHEVRDEQGKQFVYQWLI